MVFGGSMFPRGITCRCNDGDEPSINNVKTVTIDNYIYNDIPYWYDANYEMIHPINVETTIQSLLYVFTFYGTDTPKYVSTTENVIPRVKIDGRPVFTGKYNTIGDRFMWDLK